MNLNLKIFKNIIVIDNNSSDNTYDEIKKTNAICFKEKNKVMAHQLSGD